MVRPLRRSSLILAATFFVPIAAAGSEDYPEIVDPAGDSRALDGRGDILKAWLWEQWQSREVQFALLTSSLTPDENTSFGLNWTHIAYGAASPEIRAWSLVAHLDAGNIRGELLQERESMFTKVADVRTGAMFGSPGRIKWNLTYSEFDARNHDDLTLSIVQTHGVRLALLRERLDTAVDLGSTNFKLGHRLDGNTLVARPPDAVDPAGDAAPGHVDMVGVWLERVGTLFNITFGFRESAGLSMEPCDARDFEFDLRGPEQHLRYQEELKSGTITTPSLTIDGEPTVGAQSHYVAGAPGFFRLTVPENQWTDSPRVEDVSLGARAVCSQTSGDTEDLFSFRATSEGVPTLSFAVLIAAALLPAFFRKSR